MVTILSFLAWFVVVIVFTIIPAAAIIYKLAENNKFFCFKKEGKIIVVMVNEVASKFIASIRGEWINPDTGEIFDESKLTPEQIKKKEENSTLFTEILDYFGIAWIGIWPFADIYKYKFKWNEWNKKKDSTEYELIAREENVNSLFYRFPYPIKIENAETKGKVPVIVLILATTRVVNADKALFKAGGEWLANVSAAIQSAVRDFIGRHEFEELTALQHESGTSGFVNSIKDLNTSDKGNKGLVETFGISIDMVNFLSCEISGPDGARLVKASTEKYVAAQEAEAAREKAGGEADVIKKKADADAEAIRKKAGADAEAIKKIGAAKAKAISSEGEAEAEVTKKRYRAIKTHPNGAEIAKGEAIADAIKNTNASTLIFGQNSIPFMPLPTSGQENNKP